ncbi:MAG: NAD-dependent epimerase/dehydratase family protein [Thermoguttaceae bacterium]
MKQCVVTGGAGFIGSHLVEYLLARGDRVSVIDDESTGTVANLSAVVRHPNLKYTRGTAADRELVRRRLLGADEVYHLAAAVGVQLIASSPIHTIEANVYPTEIILDELGHMHEDGHDVKLFLASTSEVYGKNPKDYYLENDDLVFGPTTRPRWSYGVSKAIDEFLALAYWSERGLPVVVGRFFNVVGPRQSGAYGMVLPRFVDSALKGEPLTVHDDGAQVRCFAHVSDVIYAMTTLMNTPVALGNVFNIGSDSPISILELAQKVIAAVDPSLAVRFQSYEEAYSANFEDCRSRIPCLDKLRATIDFSPKHTLDDVIREVIASKRQALTQ